MIRSLLVALVIAVTVPAFASDKTKAIAIAQAACACETAECQCRQGKECACTQCKCVDAKMAAIGVALSVCELKATHTAKFVIVTGTNCEPCERMKASEVPTLRKSAEVEVVLGGHSATAYPTIIYEVDGREKWRVVGFTAASTLLSLTKN